MKRRKWSFEDCQLEAKKFTGRNEFKTNSSKAYKAAWSKGWLDDICLHMNPKHKSWTYKSCKEEALKYKSRYKFSIGSNRAYQAAWRNEWLSDICSHMENKHKISRSFETYRNRKTILYYIKINEVYKVGIAIHERYENPMDTIKKQRYTKSSLSINNILKIIDYKIYNDGYLAAFDENEIIEMYKEYKYIGENFITGTNKSKGESECFNINIYKDIKYYFKKEQHVN